MPDSPRVVYTFGAQAPKEPAEKKLPAKTRRLAGVALLVILLIMAVVVAMPGRVKALLLQLPGARAALAAASVAVPDSLPAVRLLWQELNFGAMPATAAQDLESGKYYYDNRFPGNFGLAISHWKLALAELSGADSSRVHCLVASAEQELARQFHTDSGDVVVLLKQGKRDQALFLLGKMRADFTDITARQYRWASATLARLRR